MKQVFLLHEFAHALMAKALGIKGHIEEVMDGYVFELDEDAPAKKVAIVAMAPFLLGLPSALALIYLAPAPLKDLFYMVAVMLVLIMTPSDGDIMFFKRALSMGAERYSDLVAVAMTELEAELRRLRDEYARLTNRANLYEVDMP